MNFFEGARRIVYVLAFIWIGAALFLVSESDYSPTFHYKIAWPGQGPSKYDGDCFYPNKEEMHTIQKDGDTVAHISLCFLAQAASNGKMLIPYAKADGENKFWLSPSYSDNVTNYTAQTMNAAVSAGAFNPDISGIPWRRYLNTAESAAKLVFGGLLAIFLFSRVVGWIVRGFMGIPIGKDRKPESGSDS